MLYLKPENMNITPITFIFIQYHKLSIHLKKYGFQYIKILNQVFLGRYVRFCPKEDIRDSGLIFATLFPTLQ